MKKPARNGSKTLSANEMEASEVPTTAVDSKSKKRDASEVVEEYAKSRKMPKRSVACADFKEKPLRLLKKVSVLESKEVHIVDEEISAIRLTHGPDDPRPNRRLTDFDFHNVDGSLRPFEMSEAEDLFISGLIVSLEGSLEKEKENGVRCEGFGRVESWAISGYEDATLVVWISTEIADYVCMKPASCYKKFYDPFLEKSQACIEIYKILSKPSEGESDLGLDELLARVVRSLSASKNFHGGLSTKDFILSQGSFIYTQLISLDETPLKIGKAMSEFPVLVTLREECQKLSGSNIHPKLLSNGILKIDEGEQKFDQADSSICVTEGDEDQKLAKLLQEAEDCTSRKQNRNKRSTSASNKYYLKINEDEIANDYPLPAYYKSYVQETDEYLVFDSDTGTCYPDELPKSMLHDWSLYNSDSRFISLELLPMKSCAEVDVTIFGSGMMTPDDGSGFCLDDPTHSSSGTPGGQGADGIPIYLSEIKEWMIEFGASMVFVSIRTDMAWYRLGKPSKQYAQWYEPILKTARLAISIITLLKEQTRVSRLSFTDVIKNVSEFKKDHLGYISSIPTAVERYVVVHGQIIIQLFAEYPDATIRKSAFVTGLSQKMEERHHTKLVMKKKLVTQNQSNLNPRAYIEPAKSKRKAMQATTTRLINRIWRDYYANYSVEELNKDEKCEIKDDEEVEDEVEENEEVEEDVKEDEVLVNKKTSKRQSVSHIKSDPRSKKIIWDGESVGKTCSGEALYKRVYVLGDVVTVGSSVIIELDDSEETSIYYVEYMFEKVDGKKMFHGREMERGSQTVLGNTANEREVFLTNDCQNIDLKDIKQTVVVDIRLMPWGHQHRKDNTNTCKVDMARAEERKQKGLPMEYYCKSLYWPERGAFFKLPADNIGLGSGACGSCEIRESNLEKELFRLNSSQTIFTYKGTDYEINDFFYVSAQNFAADTEELATFKSGRNVGLKPYVVCQLLSIDVPKKTKEAKPESTKVKVRRFFRPDDISSDKAYTSDIREVYYSEQVLSVHVEDIEGKCEIRKKHDLPSVDGPLIFEHIFFCEHQYDPDKGTVKQMPVNAGLKFSKGNTVRDVESRKRKGKCKEGESETAAINNQEASRLATLDIFAGCGGLSDGLQKSGVSHTKWAIEYEDPAGEAFRRNHPDALMFVDNCNVILRAIIEKCGEADDCITTPEAVELVSKLGEEKLNSLPSPGEVDFINGGPPCQGFSGMNRFNQGTWSKVQCEMILAFLSFVDIFRPRFFLLENVRTFVSFNKGQTFRLTLASLLEMGYQVRFGILEAGVFGVSQSRKRAFIWAASPEEILPEWPRPMHVFAGPELKISLPNDVRYAAVQSTAGGAPFRAITVRDTIGDLPEVSNGAAIIDMEYQNEPVSWFQNQIRGKACVLSDHISKEMNELNLIRCQRIPKRPGADWQCLPEEKVKLSTGQVVDLIPWCLPNTAKRHNQWKGLFGRLDWEGNFPTSVTDPQPMGKVGMCFHPDQDRILTVRECARSQGFPDSYRFAGNIHSKHRQIGNAVPPPLAYALGKKLKEAMDGKLAAVR